MTSATYSSHTLSIKQQSDPKEAYRGKILITSLVTCLDSFLESSEFKEVLLYDDMFQFRML